MEAFNEIDGIDNIAIEGEFVRLSLNECYADSGVLLTENETATMIERLELCAIQLKEQAEHERLQAFLEGALQEASLQELRDVKALLAGELPHNER